MIEGLAPLTVAVHSVRRSARDELAADVRAGLSQPPRWLPPRWFYDEEGSRLFDLITELPEYYQTRTETGILHDNAAAIAALARPEALVELGAGSCSKTRVLIDACRARGDLRIFTPFDVSDNVVWRTSHELVDEYPGLTVYGLVGDFTSHLGFIPRLGRRLVVFLGSTIGNLEGEERSAFLGEVRSLLDPGDTFLCGFDLVKDRAELVAAYDDSAGVTAAFNRNVLRVVNRELGADFDVDAYAHVALYDSEHDRIEMHLRAQRPQTVTIPGARMRVDLAGGETIRTEISAKFTRASVEGLFAEASMQLEEWFTDPAERFALALASPVTRRSGRSTRR
jgi:L-histidine N-alpha-methyltransferase